MNHAVSDGGELVELGALGVNPSGEIVEITSGGWISGPSLDGFEPEDFPDTPYGENIVRFMADYTDFVIVGRERHRGYRAYLRGQKSRAVGRPVIASSLDALAPELNRIRRRMDGV